jgi:hypothetical protein
MKLSIYTFIALLITAMTAPAFAEKPEGETKRYTVVLDKKKFAAENTSDTETRQNTEAIDQVASDETDAEHGETDATKSKWWKLWGKDEHEIKQADKGSETGQLKREENSRKWWKLWSESDPESENVQEKPKTAQEKPEEKNKKWWKPWSDGETEEISKKSEATQEKTKEDKSKWWKPWN